MQAGPSDYLPSPVQIPTMHYYVNPVTGEQIVSPLPPSHPEMICLQEGHIGRTRFGLLGTYFRHATAATKYPFFIYSKFPCMLT